MRDDSIKFKKGDKEMTFRVIHNLDEFQLSIENAFINWSVRTNKFTMDDFCNYVVSKNPGHLICKEADPKWRPGMELVNPFKS